MSEVGTQLSEKFSSLRFEQFLKIMDSGPHCSVSFVVNEHHKNKVKYALRCWLISFLAESKIEMNF
jgi:hypothetical protein